MKNEELRGDMGMPYSKRHLVSNAEEEQRTGATTVPWQPHEVEAVIAQCNNVRDFISLNYKEMLQTNQQLSEAYDDLEIFSYSISHDLRAPLRTIEAYADILKENYRDVLGEQGLQLLSTIGDSSVKLNELISGLLAYTRAGRKNLILNAISLRDAIIFEAKDLLEEAQRQGRRVELKLPDSLPDVMADKPAFSILLKNLLSNAFKYSANANPAIIEVGGEQAEGFTKFYVRDNGIGFNMQHAGRVFGVFSRLVNEEQFEGTGIGLAIVKRIVEKHGGSINVESEMGMGTTFFVKLPALVA